MWSGQERKITTKHILILSVQYSLYEAEVEYPDKQILKLTKAYFLKKRTNKLPGSKG